jgi:hypothetical protein
MIKMNEWVGEYYTYGRLNSQGFCMLEDIDHALKSGEWDKAKAIEYVMWNHNIEKDQATGMVEWAMSMLTMPGFVVAEDVPEPEVAEATESAVCECIIAGYPDRFDISEGGASVDGYAELKIRLGVIGSVVLGNTEIGNTVHIDIRVTDHKNNIYKARKELVGGIKGKDFTSNIKIKSMAITEKDGE